MTDISTTPPHDAQNTGMAPAPHPHGTPPFNGIPPHPKHFVGRSDLVDALVMELTGDTLPRQTLSLVGPTGSGKTAIAAMIAHHPRIHTYFAGGVLWASLGQQPDLMAVLGRWAQALGLHIFYMTDP